MIEHIIKYNISPRVVRADSVQKVRIEGLDDGAKFYDDIEYNIKLTRVDDGWDYESDKQFLNPGRKASTEFKSRSKDSVLEFEYDFPGETEWVITVSPCSDKHIPPKNKKYDWSNLDKQYMNGFKFNMYSLNEDLYNVRFPFKGDLHIHSSGSDGVLDPGATAAQYRKYGFDFIALTDHYTMEPSLTAIERFKDINTSFKIFQAEEIHPMVTGIFHVVNFDCKESVNKIVWENPDGTLSEVKKIAQTIDTDDETLAMELAWFVWINDNIHKSGGVSIYPHPYWITKDSYSVRQTVSREILERGLCDVFEIFGGNPVKENNMQAQLFYSLRGNKKPMPIVASTDAHSAYYHGRSNFDNYWTIAFAETVDNVRDAILDYRSVAVDNCRPQAKNILGDLRLVKYAWFIVENYFETHDELCNAAGQAILRYVYGNKVQNNLIGMLEKEIANYKDEFFGK